MNELETEKPDCGAQLDSLVRKNPTQTILWALGMGVALACVVRALQPRPVEHRAAHLLDNLREQLNDLAQPAMRRASSLASNGASLAQNGAAHLSQLKLDRHLDSVASKLRGLFR